MPLNPEALESLYRVIVSTRLLTNIRTTHPHLWNQLSDAIALAESPAAPPPSGMTPLQARNHAFVWPEPPVPPSGAMTIERAREIAAALIRKSTMRTWAELTNGVHEADIVSAILDTDRAARLETLEWVRDHVLINDRADDGPMHVAIERRLREIKDAG